MSNAKCHSNGANDCQRSSGKLRPSPDTLKEQPYLIGDVPVVICKKAISTLAAMVTNPAIAIVLESFARFMPRNDTTVAANSMRSFPVRVEFG